MLWIGGAVVAQGAGFEEEFNALCDGFAAVPRPRLEEKFEAFVLRHVEHPRIAEAQYYLAVLRQDRSEREYLDTIKEVVENYQGAKNHFHYLRMLTTYAQVVAPEEDRERIFREMLDILDEGVMTPLPRWGITDPEEARSVRRQAAVWAELHEKTRRVKDLKARADIAEATAKDLAQRRDGEQVAAYAYEWMRTDALAASPAPPAENDAARPRLPSQDSAPAPIRHPDPVFRADPSDDMRECPGDDKTAPLNRQLAAGVIIALTGMAFFAISVLGNRKKEQEM